jgi:hypothetical protein
MRFLASSAFKAVRTGIRLTLSPSASSVMVTEDPGESLPETMACRISL